MPRPTRLAAGVVLWAAAVGAALAVGLTAVGAIGTGLLGPGEQVLTPAQVDVLLASTEPASPAPPAPATADPVPVDPGPADAAAAPEVVATAGGTVLVRCTGGLPEVVSATPAQGFRVQTEQEDGRPRVRFRDGGTRIEISVGCVDGRPVADVESED